MNTVVIILGVIIVFLVYILYKFFTNTSKSLQSQANLNYQVSGMKIYNPQATRYAYGIWLYVNTWNSNIYHVVFSRANNLILYLDKSTPTLICKLNMSDNTTQSLTITDNFPLQKWVNIVISVDNQFVDAYLDGKLIQSKRFYSTNSNGTTIIPKVPPDENTLIFVGNSELTAYKSLDSNSNTLSNWDAYITKFKQWSSGPVDPQTVWNYYMDGNGSLPLLSSLGNYGMNLQVLKNNVESNKIQLF